MSQSINWKEKLPIAAVFILLVLLAVLYTQIQTNLTYEQKSCILGGGQWGLISDCNGPPGGLCDGGSTPGCDCGPDKYWDPSKLKCRANT